jgi:hypothetical protein
MKGTILDFLKLAAEKPELAQELVELTAKHEFEFTDEVSDEELERVAGGATIFGNAALGSSESGGIPPAREAGTPPGEPMPYPMGSGGGQGDIASGNPLDNPDYKPPKVYFGSQET